MQGIMSEEVDAARIGCQISADLAATFGSQVDRTLMILGSTVVLQLLKHTPCFCPHDAVGVIKAQNSIHEGHIDNDLVTDGLAAQDQARVASLWRYS